MRKIPTLFEREWAGDRSRVVRRLDPVCDWIARGEGLATVKLDGMCAAVIDGALWKRREVKAGRPAPEGFRLEDRDETTGKATGWVRVGEGAEDRWFREAWGEGGLPDGTYELVGPRSQGGVERVYARHALVRHGAVRPAQEPPRDFEGLRAWLAGRDLEGLVWHHPDGRMGKIKLRDFGLERVVSRR